MFFFFTLGPYLQNSDPIQSGSLFLRTSKSIPAIRATMKEATPLAPLPQYFAPCKGDYVINFQPPPSLHKTFVTRVELSAEGPQFWLPHFIGSLVFMPLAADQNQF